MITLKTYKTAEHIENQDGVLTPQSGKLASVQIDVYTNPSYYITGATSMIQSGTTTGSTYVYSPNYSASTEGVTLGFIFTGGTDTLTASTTTFNFNIYGYDPDVATFGNHVRYGTFVFPPLSFNMSATTLNQLIDYGTIQGTLPVDNEYIVKPSFTYSATTLITAFTFNTLDLTDINTPIDLTGNTFGLFKTGGTDGYFVIISNPPIPTLNLLEEIITPPSDFVLTLAQTDPRKGNLELAIPAPHNTRAVSTIKTESFTVGFSGQSEFILNDKADGDVLVTVNGVTLLKETEYTYVDNRTNTTTVYIDGNNPLLPSDVLQMIYITDDPSGEGLTVETYDVTSILSGATGDQPAGAKVYYNTTHFKYEYYLDYNSDGTPINLIVNGIELEYNEDFYPSISQLNMLIFDSASILPGDRIAAYYTTFPSAQVDISLDTKDLAVSWESSPPPNIIPGWFHLQVAASADTSYSSVLYSGITQYVSGQTDYRLDLTITGLNQTYLYRVVSEKMFTTLTYDLLTTMSYSENGSFNTNNKALNAY